MRTSPSAFRAGGGDYEVKADFLSCAQAQTARNNPIQPVSYMLGFTSIVNDLVEDLAHPVFDTFANNTMQLNDTKNQVNLTEYYQAIHEATASECYDLFEQAGRSGNRAYQKMLAIQNRHNLNSSHPRLGENGNPPINQEGWAKPLKYIS